MPKQIKELTEQEAKEILAYVYPDAKYIWFTGLAFEPVPDEKGRIQISIGTGRPIVGIKYHNGQDNCLLHFDNTKAVYWLHTHGYDVTELLELNQFLSEVESNYDQLLFQVYHLYKMYPVAVERGKGDLYNLEYVLGELERIYNKHVE